MFERLTPFARQVVVAAQQEARRLGHPDIRAEHLLLAASADPAGACLLRATGVTHESLARDVAAHYRDEALAVFGIDLQTVRHKAEAAFGPGALDRPPTQRGRVFRRARPAPSAGVMRFTLGARRSLEQAVRQAQALHSTQLDVGHLLLGLLADDEADAARAVRRVGGSPAVVRQQVLEQLRRSA